MKKINLLDIRNKKLELTKDLREELLAQLNDNIITQEEMEAVFSDDLEDYDSVCTECYGQVIQTRAEVGVCQGCTIVEGSTIEVTNYPSLNIMFLNDYWAVSDDSLGNRDGF